VVQLDDFKFPLLGPGIQWVRITQINKYVQEVFQSEGLGGNLSTAIAQPVGLDNHDILLPFQRWVSRCVTEDCCPATMLFHASPPSKQASPSTRTANVKLPL
jgi:hypothetical protein